MSSANVERETIEAIILAAIRRINLARAPEDQLEESGTAQLYGSGSALDSLGLVALLLEVEEGLLEAGIEVSLSDERAMSQSRSPFRTVLSLVDYIQSTLDETVT